MLKTLSTNKLTSHPAYPKILAAYNAQLKEKGKVSALKFYKEVILPEIPDYDQSSWYYFLRKFKTAVGIVPIDAGGGRTPTGQEGAVVEADLATTLLANGEATQKAIAMALNISVEALQDLMANPTSMSLEKRVELFLKVMKAQDSRVKAIGTIKADNREQARFDHAMDSAAFA